MYPSKELIVETLVSAARHAAADQRLDHPEDYAAQMTAAIDAAADTIMILHNSGNLLKD